MKEYAESFYKSNAWRQCRLSYLKSVGGLCERCYQKGLFVPAKIVHHKIYITPDNITDPSITFNFNNLEALCQDCHNKEHDAMAQMTKSMKRYKVNEYGEVIILERA